MEKQGLRFQKGDLLAVGAVLLLAAMVFVLFLPARGEEGQYAQIYQNGVLIKTVSLSENQEFVIAGNHRNTIAVRDGKIGIIASDCPGGDCMRQGFIANGGRSVVCLPNGVEIRIVTQADDVDFVVG